MGTVISNLKARFGVDTTDFKRGLKEGEDSLVQLDRKVGSAIQGLQKMLSPLALLGAAGGAIAMFKGAIESVEGPGDRFEAIIGGGKEALFEFNRALGTLNFTGLLTGISEGFKRGKEFAELMDSLSEKSAYNDYRIAQLKRESEALQEITKDKTKEISVRADAAEKVKAIEEKILERKKELAREEFDIIKGQWEGRNKMEAASAIELYETIDKMGPELQKRLQKVFEGATFNQFGSVKKAIQSVLFGQYDPQLVKEIPASTLESYAKFYTLIEGGEKEVLQKLFNTFKNIDEKGYQAQAEYNGVVASTTKLLAAENKELAGKEKTLNKIAAAQEKAAALANAKSNAGSITKVDTSHLTPPDFKQYVSNVLAPLMRVKDEVNNVLVDLSSSVATALDSMAVATGEFFGALMSGDASIGDFGSKVLGVFANLLMSIGEAMVAAGVAKLAFDLAMITFGGAGVAIAAGLGLVAAGAAIKGAMSKSSNPGAGSGFTYDSRTTPGSNITQPQTVTINGELKVRGPDLVYVFSKENNRRKTVT